MYIGTSFGLRLVMMNQAQLELERLKHIVHEADGIWVGVQYGTIDGVRYYDDMVLFNNRHGDTMNLKVQDVTVERVRAKLKEKELQRERIQREAR